jgi:hypothetical protein
VTFYSERKREREREKRERAATAQQQHSMADDLEDRGSDFDMDDEEDDDESMAPPPPSTLVRDEGDICGDGSILKEVVRAGDGCGGRAGVPALGSGRKLRS